MKRVFASIIALTACDETIAAQRANDANDAGATTVTPTSPVPCTVSALSGVEVPAGDLRRFPPYAAAGCRLAYVDAAGALKLRDLATGSETLLAPATDSPKRPTISEEVAAWEATVDGRTRVRIAWRGAVLETSSGLTAANEAKAFGASVVFTAWTSAPPLGDANVWIFDAEKNESREVFGGAGQQRFADLSREWIAITDFSEDPDGRFDDNGQDVADIVLVSRATGEVIRRTATGKQAFPMLVSDNLLGYLDWNTVHPEPKLEAYTIRVAGQRALPTDDRTIADVKHFGMPALPLGRDGVFEWVAMKDDDTPTLFRAPADQSKPPAPTGVTDVELAVPSATQLVTIVAARATNGKAVTPLRVIPR